MTIENPVYEWIEAAHYDGLSYEEFKDREVWYQELIIAAYRTKMQTESALAWANRPKKGARKR